MSTVSYRTTFPINIPSKTGYKLLDIQYVGYTGIRGAITTAETISNFTGRLTTDGQWKNGMELSFLNTDKNATTFMGLFWIEDAPSFLYNISTTHYFHFKALYIKE
jgi:hypothetical protein